MVIYTTEITLLAQDLTGLPSQLGTLVLSKGGYVAGVETKDDGGVPTIIVRLKVPPEQYEVTMASIRNLAVEVRGEKATTQDVTEEYSDTQTQIGSLEAQHAQLLELMKHTGSVDELLKVQQQADQVRLQIDRLKGRATALERLSALASITVTAQAAGVVLEREYVSDLSAVRQAETQQAGLVAQLKRARTPEEEAKLRDSLGQVELQLQRARQQLDRTTQTAGRLGVALPQPADEVVAVVGDDNLAAQYIQTRVDLRKAQADQQRITAELEAGAAGATPEQLQAAILHTNELSLRLKTLQDRAGQAGITLPVISPDEEAAMARVVGPATGSEALATLRRAWNLSLGALVSLGSTIVFLWWLLLPLGAAGILLARRRRRPA
jgi:ribosomal protein S8